MKIKLVGKTVSTLALSLEVTHSSSVRLISYLLPALLGSLILNIPKFLEARLDMMTYVADNVTQEYLFINVTSLRVFQISHQICH